MVEECRGCGSRRTVNVNQSHRDVGAWGPSREQRVVQLITVERRMEQKYKEALSHACDFMSPDGRMVAVSVSREGRVLLIGDPRTRQEDMEIAYAWSGLPMAQALIELVDEVFRRRAEI